MITAKKIDRVMQDLLDTQGVPSPRPGYRAALVRVCGEYRYLLHKPGSGYRIEPVPNGIVIRELGRGLVILKLS